MCKIVIYVMVLIMILMLLSQSICTVTSGKSNKDIPDMKMYSIGDDEMEAYRNNHE
jgi:hypothetical protein